MSVIIEGFKVPSDNEPKTFLSHFYDDGTAEMVAVGYPQIKYHITEVKKGKWILNKDGSGTCSECGRKQYNCYDADNWDNFCHFCGADMR